MGWISADAERRERIGHESKEERYDRSYENLVLARKKTMLLRGGEWLATPQGPSNL